MMPKLELLLVVAFVALALCTDVDEGEQKKRGVGKGTSLNSITTGAQKQDYTYSIYSQSPTSQSSQTNSYQSSFPNSFYPNQRNQYYSSTNNQVDSSPSYQSQHEPQINLSHQPSPTQFVPLNFVPNSSYQSKYQFVPSKPNGNIQLAVVQQPPNYPSAHVVPFNPSLYSPNANGPQHNSLISLSPGYYNVAPNYQPFSGSYLTQPSPMLLFAQPHHSLYNNFLYPNPIQSFYNYNPSNSQSKYVPYATSGSAEYDKYQGPISQSIKEENDISHSSEYTEPSDSNSSYKSAYSASRNTYSKL